MGSDQFSRGESRFYAVIVFWCALYYEPGFDIAHAFLIIWPVRFALVQLRRLGTRG